MDKGNAFSEISDDICFDCNCTFGPDFFNVPDLAALLGLILLLAAILTLFKSLFTRAFKKGGAKASLYLRPLFFFLYALFFILLTPPLYKLFYGDWPCLFFYGPLVDSIFLSLSIAAIAVTHVLTRKKRDATMNKP